MCANKVPGVINGPAPRGHSLYRFIYMYIANILENLLMNHWPEFFLNWHGAFLSQGDLTVFPGVTDGPTFRKGPKRGISLKKSSDDEPVDQMQNCLTWIIPMTCRYKIVQLLSL